MQMVREGKESDHKNIKVICSELSDWFTESGLNEISIDLCFQKQLVIIECQKIVGFTSYFTFQGDMYIAWIAVSRSKHRRGLGTKMIRRLVKVAKKLNIEKLVVFTLARNIEYEPYEHTRNFYESLGFVENHQNTFKTNSLERLVLKIV